MPLASRTRLGHYEIDHLIGSGGMGEVYYASDTRLGRVVALKVLSSEATSDPERRRRFLQEARSASALNHPNIITIHDVGTDNGIDYIAMELVTGKTLAQSIPAAGLDPCLALRLAQQIAGALSKAHAGGVIHRDLKPANIMVTEDGVVKVLDFGLAKTLETSRLTDPDATRTVSEFGMIVGTVNYMSPEQAEGRPVDARSDIFALGVVLYEMLSGRRAFAGATAISTMAAILNKEPPALENIREFQSVLDRCLKKDPAERFQSMMEVRQALEAAAEAQLEPPEHNVSSVAVMPFTSLSSDRENDYFSDGLAEEIIIALTRVPGLKVAGKTSSFWFRDKGVKPFEIGQALKVQHILEGSVRRSGTRVRVTPQLIKVSDGFQLWSERFDRELTDIFAVQDEISHAIAEALELRFSQKLTHRKHQPSLPAYEAFLKGRGLLGKSTPEGLAQAKESLEKAIALDPQYAEAHVQLGYYCNMLCWLQLKPAREVMPLAKAHLNKALELDSSLPNAHALLGTIAAVYDYDWREAARRFAIATATQPVTSFVRYCYGPYYLLPTGRPGEAAAELIRGLEDDPLFLNMRAALGFCLLAAGHYDQAQAELLSSLTIDPSFWAAHWIIGECYASLGQMNEARVALEEAYKLAPYFAEVIGLLAGVLRHCGEEARAEEMLARLKASEATQWMAKGLTMYHLVCGETDAAADWFERRLEERGDFSLFQGLWSPLAAKVRSSSRWPAIARKLNLHEAASA